MFLCNFTFYVYLKDLDFHRNVYWRFHLETFAMQVLSFQIYVQKQKTEQIIYVLVFYICNLYQV